MNILYYITANEYKLPGANMKKVLTYILLMSITVVILPLLIVKGCDRVHDEGKKHEIQPGKISVNVFIESNDKIAKMELEKYAVGVVAAEMPAEFELEALKAQAVAARTYAYRRIKDKSISKEDKHSGAEVCTSPLCCQAWVSDSDAKPDGDWLNISGTGGK